MDASGLLDLIDRWDTGAGQTAHRRLAALLGDEAELADDTLGRRNRRLIALHEHWVDRPIMAHVACPQCGTANEFALPLAAMKEQDDPSPDVRANVAGRSFRLPTMADLAAVGADPVALAQRCAVGRHPPLAPDRLRTLGDAFEALDPLAKLAVTSHCNKCGEAVAADVDLAEFVVAELTRFVDLLLRDVDVIAGAYGWGERDILALPPERRARYVALIAGRRGPRALTGEAFG